MTTRASRLAAIFFGICIIGLIGLLAPNGTALRVDAAQRCHACGQRHASRVCAHCPPNGHGEWAGTWYWQRSPEQERRVIASLFNRYCIRCHGVDGRGVWDIPDVPNFANARWQHSRSDAELARLILEGRGAVMPPFRGTLTLEEAWAMARYLRTFVPGTEMSRPDLQSPTQQFPDPQPTASGPVLDSSPTTPAPQTQPSPSS